jgi:hypothetical protein
MDLKAQQRSALARNHEDYLLRCYARTATNFEAGLARAVFVRPGLMLERFLIRLTRKEGGFQALADCRG